MTNFKSLTGWSLENEISFIHGMGYFSERTIQIGLPRRMLLQRYLKGLEKRVVGWTEEQKEKLRKVVMEELRQIERKGMAV